MAWLPLAAPTVSPTSATASPASPDASLAAVVGACLPGAPLPSCPCCQLPRLLQGSHEWEVRPAVPPTRRERRLHAMDARLGLPERH